MTKAELIDKIAKTFKDQASKKMIGELVDDVFMNIGASIKKDKRFSYPGFGTWEVRARKARKGRNPQTGETIKIKASKTVGFRPAKAFKEKL